MRNGIVRCKELLLLFEVCMRSAPGSDSDVCSDVDKWEQYNSNE